MLPLKHEALDVLVFLSNWADSPRSSRAVRPSVTEKRSSRNFSSVLASWPAVRMPIRSSFGASFRPTPQTSETGSESRMGEGSAGITKTPDGSFLPMWFAIFARVLLGANPTPHGMPTHFRMVARTLQPTATASQGKSQVLS